MTQYGDHEMDLSVKWIKTPSTAAKSLAIVPTGSTMKVSNKLQAKYGNLYQSASTYRTVSNTGANGFTMNYNGTARVYRQPALRNLNTCAI